MAAKFTDNSGVIKAIIEEVGSAWLYEEGNEIASHARDNVAMDGETGNELRKSYRADVRQKEARVGTPLESGWWEEWGTGEHSVRNPHRTGWWVYIEGGSGYDKETNHYATRQEAEKAAAFLRRVKKLKAVVTNGRPPNYTLEKAFRARAPKMEKSLQEKLNARLGK